MKEILGSQIWVKRAKIRFLPFFHGWFVGFPLNRIG